MRINILKITSVFCFLLPYWLEAQVQITDFSKVEESRIEKYDSSYFQPNYLFSSIPVMNGLVGNSLIFLAEPIYGYEIYQNNVKQNSVDAFKKYLFLNCKIEKVINGKFHLSCQGDSIMYEPKYSDEKNIIIVGGFEKFKNKHIAKKFYSLSNTDFKSLENFEVKVIQGQLLTITNVEIVKLSQNTMGVGINFSSQNQHFTIAMNFEDNYLQYGGDPKGKIDFDFEYINRLEIVDETLNSEINKSLYKKNILKGEIVVGMTEKEIRIVWGMPSRNKMAQSYENVMIYEIGNTTYYFYIKGKKLVKISQL